ncbi:hypothetical protein [Nocardia abscessus]|uniref:hypothetical protein n=1 Tax=Nocardia abscessus TaxID=120957 RepID=UPI002455CAA5|nr:hypothetical protein [Nocardia abscessus]
MATWVLTLPLAKRSERYGMTTHAMPRLIPSPTVIAGEVHTGPAPCTAEMVCCPAASGIQVVVAWLPLTGAGLGEKVPAALSENWTDSAEGMLSTVAVTRYWQFVP